MTTPVQALASSCDVVVIGGGLSGKAASLHLAKAGLKVTCIEPAQTVRQAVGESLDWSSPDLLKDLGLPADVLIKTQTATWKRHVVLKLIHGASEDYTPLPWLGGAPFHIELSTIHVDRLRLDQELQQTVTNLGITMVHDKVVRVETTGKRVSAVQTAGGQSFSAPWFIDASGFAACILAREFKLPAIHSGPPKVAVWTYFPVSQAIEGTTLHMQPTPTEYLEWIWEIPVNPDVVSVGYVTTGAAMKAKRDEGLSVEEIFHRQLSKFPRFQSLLQAGALSVPYVTSFRGRVYHGAAGPNWLVVGEAASMVDPITSNGVTAALRHAQEASALILKYRKRTQLPLVARFCYSCRVSQMAKFFNMGIEKIVYETPVRNRIGIRHAGTVYISPAWGMNVVYARLKPSGIFSTMLLSLSLGFFQASTWLLHQFCKLLPQPAEAEVC
jgi:menaquinone-9 beta-reductase